MPSSIRGTSGRAHLEPRAQPLLRRAGIVLNDHWPDMRSQGFISNRVYDALASGAFVISDAATGIAEEFDGAVATYTTRSELRDTVDAFLADPDGRREHAAEGARSSSSDTRSRIALPPSSTSSERRATSGHATWRRGRRSSGGSGAGAG